MCHRYRLFKEYVFVHTADERVNISYHMEAVKFTNYKLLRNLDVSKI